MTEVRFDDLEGFEAVFASDEYLERVRPDEESILDLASGDMSLTVETVVTDGNPAAR